MSNDKTILLSSTTTLPMSQAISRRLVPGASPVEVMYSPVVPLSYSKYANSATACTSSRRSLQGSTRSR